MTITFSQHKQMYALYASAAGGLSVFGVESLFLVMSAGNVAVSHCFTVSLYSARALFRTCPAGAGGHGALFSGH